MVANAARGDFGFEALADGILDKVESDKTIIAGTRLTTNLAVGITIRRSVQGFSDRHKAKSCE